MKKKKILMILDILNVLRRKYYLKLQKILCFFVNKIDLLEDKDKEIKSFKENMVKNKLGIDLSNNYIDNISSTQLTEER
jgi:hypothetical protein